jgi:hypothetical protein
MQVMVSFDRCVPGVSRGGREAASCEAVNGNAARASRVRIRRNACGLCHLFRDRMVKGYGCKERMAGDKRQMLQEVYV